MIAQNSGSIVTLGSIAGMGAFPLRAYSPSKTAIMRLTQILAVEMGRFGVRVNGVAPTYVLNSTIKSRIDVGLRDPNRIRKAGALEMFALPEYTAEVINFLCSDAAAAIAVAAIMAAVAQASVSTSPAVTDCTADVNESRHISAMERRPPEVVSPAWPPT